MSDQRIRIPVRLPRVHPGQAEILGAPERFLVICTGRRWGKTRLGALLCVLCALRGGRAWWIAPTYLIAGIGWRLMVRMAMYIPGVRVSRADLCIYFPNGGEIWIKTGHEPDRLRGEGLDLVVADEAAYLVEEVFTEAIRPALSDRKGRAVFFSSPARKNWFYRLWMRGEQGHKGWRSFSFPSSGNPYLDPAEIEDARLDMPEDSFLQEYLAVFLESGGAVFRNLARALILPPDDPALHPDRHRGHRIVAGLDWGRTNDATAVSIVCAPCKKELELVRWRGMRFPEQQAEIVKLQRRFRIQTLNAEANSVGTPNIEALQDLDMPVRAFNTTNASKAAAVQSLQLCLERLEVLWLADKAAAAEMEAFEISIKKETGRPVYGAPKGLHDDTVIARMLALDAVVNDFGVYTE